MADPDFSEFEPAPAPTAPNEDAAVEDSDTAETTEAETPVAPVAADDSDEPGNPDDAGDELTKILATEPQRTSVKLNADQVPDDTPSSEDPVQEDGTIVLKPRAAEGEPVKADLRYRQDPNETQDIRYVPDAEEAAPKADPDVDDSV